MLNKNSDPLVYWEKINNFKYLGSLLIIIIGIFLCPKTAYLSTVTPENIIGFTNQERIKNNLDILTFNSTLQQAAEAKAKAILASGQFQHNIGAKRFSDWIKDAGYKYSYIGENLAIDFVTSEGVINAWLESPAHKKNILNSYYEEIGVAAAEGIFDGQNTIVVAEIFGAPPLGAAREGATGFQFQNYALNKNYLPYHLSSSEQSLAPEKLLTHAASEYLTADASFSEKNSETFLAEYGENSSQKTLNNFFAQYNLSYFFKYLSLAISAILLFFIFYIYFFCFSRLSNFS